VFTSPSKIKLDNKDDDASAKNAIAQLAQLLAYLRCAATTWHTEDTEGLNYGYQSTLREDSKRASQVLYNLACGHALMHGRKYINLDDVPIVVKTVLSTAEFERARVFSLLLMNDGKLSTTDITAQLLIAPPTARRTMAEFRAIGMVEISEVEHSDSHELEMELHDKFAWFFTEEFKKLREGFEPADYHEFLNEGKSLRSKIDYITVLEQIAVFDKVFDILANANTGPLVNSADHGTVGRDDLIERLMETDCFDQEGCSNIVDSMLKLKKIEMVMINTYRRTAAADSPKTIKKEIRRK